MPSFRAAWTWFPPVASSARFNISFSTSCRDLSEGSKSAAAVSVVGEENPSPGIKSKFDACRTDVSSSTMALSMAFRSSRTFPGQLCASSCSRASGEIPSIRRSSFSLLLLSEVFDQRNDVVPVISQRRNVYLDHVQPVEQIFPKLPVAHGLAEIAIGCRDYADIDLDILDSTQPAERLIFQDTKQLCLQRKGKFSDFIQEHRAAVRKVEDALFPGSSVRKRSLLVSEQLAFEEGLRDCGAVDGHKGFVVTRAPFVDEFGQHIFPGTAFTLQQD